MHLYCILMAPLSRFEGVLAPAAGLTSFNVRGKNLGRNFIAAVLVTDREIRECVQAGNNFLPLAAYRLTPGRIRSGFRPLT